MADTPARSFEFWLGRAGSGKTHRCLRDIAEELNARPRGAPLLLLVPEQASAQMEYALATWPGVGGFTRARVLSFRLLQREVFARIGGRPEGLIDEQSRIMLLRRVIRRRGAGLQTLGDSADLPGLAETVSASILELQRYGWSADDLAATLASFEPRHDANELLYRKLSDLHLIWTDYEAELAARGLRDLACLAPAAAERIRAWEALEGARLWIDGFATFTAEEQMLLEALLSRAAQAHMTLLIDPANENDARGFFQNNQQTLRRLGERLTSLGWHVRRIPFPVEPAQPTRFTASPALLHLESQLSRPLPRRLKEAPALADRPVTGPWPSTPVDLIEAPHRRAEVDAAARRIATLCSPPSSPGSRSAHEPEPAPPSNDPAAFTPGSLAWSDVTVIVRDMETYAPLIAEIFPRYGIPHFLDRRRAISGHPLARLLLSTLDLLRHGLRTESILDYLKTGLSPLADPDAVARIERIASRRRFGRNDWPDFERWVPADLDRRPERKAAERRRLESLFRQWQRAMQPVSDLQARLASPDADAARDLWNFLDRLKCAEVVGAWIEDARTNGDPESASIHAEAWSQTLAMLDRLHMIGGRPPAPASAHPSPPDAAPAPGDASSASIVELEQNDLFGEPSAPPASPSSPSRQSGSQSASAPPSASPRTSAPTPPSESSSRSESPPRSDTAPTPASGPADLDELFQIVEAALATVRAALIPPALDQVLVGSIDRSRTPPVKAAFVLGLNDGEFPRVYEPDPILGDADRRALSDGARRLGPDSHEKYIQERFLAYVALTRASHLLVLSRPAADERGSAVSPSPFFRLAYEALGEPTITRIDAAPDAALESAGSALPLLPERWAASIAQSYRRAGEGQSPAPLARALAGLHPLSLDSLRAPAAARVRRTFAALTWPRPARLDPDLAREFWLRASSLSVTGLESFVNCGFRFFAERMLRLEPDVDPTPGVRELGILRHHVLEELFRTFNTGGRVNWADVDPDRADEVIESAAWTGAENELDAHFGRDALTRAVVDATVTELKTFVRHHLVRMAERYGFDQIAAELYLGRTGRAFTVSTPDGISLTLEGKIDRVDLLRDPSSGVPTIVLFDFKSGARPLKAGRLIDGLDIQLAAYALALQRRGLAALLPDASGSNSATSDPESNGNSPASQENQLRLAVAGLFYWPMRVGFETAEGEEWCEPGSDEWLKNRRIRGLFDASRISALDDEVVPGASSSFFMIARKADGELSRISFGGLPPHDFARYLAHVERHIESTIADIASGHIAIAPMREASAASCDHCDHACVCRVATFPAVPYRSVSNVKKNDFADKLNPGPTRA